MWLRLISRTPITHTSISGFPQLKLSPEAAEILGFPRSELFTLHPENPKLGHRAAAGFSPARFPLAAVYILEEFAGDEPEVERLGSAQAVIELIRHSYAAGLLVQESQTREKQGVVAHLGQCVELVRHIGVRRLKRARRLQDLSQVALLVEQDCTA